MIEPQAVRQAMYETEDLKLLDRTFQGKSYSILYLDSLSDDKKLSRILEHFGAKQSEEEILPLQKEKVVNTVDECVKALLEGDCLFVETESGNTNLFDAKAKNQRSITEPTTEKVLQGVHTGFIEDLNTNIHLIRSIAPMPDLTVKYYELGALKSKFALLYRAKCADQEQYEELDRRLKAIPADAGLNIGLLEDWTEDHPFSLFPQMLKTERPDRVVAQLYKEKFVLMQQGYPLCLIMPVDFLEFFHTADDNNLRWIAASLYRMLRIAAFFIAVTLPALYISIVSYHLEVIPSELTLRVKTALEGIPYPPLIEALIMSIAIELIVEAGIRMPTGVGQIIGIVGGLVIGDAVVKAGLVSNLMVITIAITTVSSFIVPGIEMNHTVRIIRVPISFLSAILGFYGIIFGVLFAYIHMCRLTSLNVPFMNYASPITFKTVLGRVLRGHPKLAYKGKKDK